MTTIEQGGAIVMRRLDDHIEVLLVRGKRPPHPWIFPKGHVEAGEAPEQTAHRELGEEAGVTGRLIGRVGDTEFVLAERRYHVIYFLFELRATGAPHEPREQRWFAEDEARRHLPYDGLKPLLRQAMRLFRRSHDR